MSPTRSLPEENAIALGGVEIGNGIAKEQPNAVPSIIGDIEPTPKPTMIGNNKFAVAVLLITEDIPQATAPNSAVNQNVLTPRTGNCCTRLTHTGGFNLQPDTELILRN